MSNYLCHFPLYSSITAREQSRVNIWSHSSAQVTGSKVSKGIVSSLKLQMLFRRFLCTYREKHERKKNEKDCSNLSTCNQYYALQNDKKISTMFSQELFNANFLTYFSLSMSNSFIKRAMFVDTIVNQFNWNGFPLQASNLCH